MGDGIPPSKLMCWPRLSITPLGHNIENSFVAYQEAVVICLTSQPTGVSLCGLEDPDLGTIHNIGIPIELSATPASIRCRAPALGEHSVEILKEAGLSGVEVEELLRAGVVKASGEGESG